MKWPSGGSGTTNKTEFLTEKLHSNEDLNISEV